MFPPWLSPISLSIKCGLKNFLSATLMSVSYDIPIPITLTWALTYILYWYCLVTTGKVHLTFANWRKSTVLSPIHLLEFRQLAEVHCTFANISPGASPIGESPLYFRQYIRGLSPLANVLLAKVLLANVPLPTKEEKGKKSIGIIVTKCKCSQSEKRNTIC